MAIACQGGGSHTAFTAGVLGRLLEADELTRSEIVGLSGTSGGAVCALLAWSALCDGDRRRAGQLLVEFWADNAADGLGERLVNSWLLLGSMLQSHGLLPAVSPYQTPVSSVGMDQFRQMLGRHVDFSRLDRDAAGRHPLLLLGAVDVRSGRFRAFNSRQERITVDRVLASAAIPTLFQAVEVDGGTYWDGLFSQNPPVRELLDTHPDELWVVQVNPRERPTVPRTLLEIADRRNELAGNLSLYQELAFIEKIDQLLEEGVLSPTGRYRRVMVRIIELPTSRLARAWGPASKLDRSPRFLAALIAEGRAQAEVFLSTLAFERAWAARDADAITGHFTDDVELQSAAPFPSARVQGDGRRAREFVEAHLCESIAIDPDRKQIAGDRVTWSIRMRRADTVVRGMADVEISGAGVSSLRLGPAR